MYRRAGRLNRIWLTVIGLLLLITAVIIGGLAAGIEVPGLGLPQPDDRAVPAGTADLLDSTWAHAAIGVVGLLLIVLGLAWLVAQLPRRDAARPLRLHGDPRGGTTMLVPSVLTRAIEAQVESLPGVTDGSALLRGTAKRPELVLKITANERADLAELLTRVHREVVRDLGLALETTPAHVGIQLEVSAASRSEHEVTVAA